jgi:hypothetical protein
MQLTLTEQDYLNASSIIGCEVKAIKAITAVEAPRGGFQTDGKLTILFEPYIFWKQLKAHGINPQPLLASNADILSSVWNPKLYGSYSSQWGKLTKAESINKVAADESASYGMFQIMGFNYKACGYSDVFSFVSALQEGVHKHLESFCTYIKAVHLDDELQNKDWAGFARGYNGPSYWRNAYDKKLLKAYDNAK